MCSEDDQSDLLCQSSETSFYWNHELHVVLQASLPIINTHFVACKMTSIELRIVYNALSLCGLYSILCRRETRNLNQRGYEFFLSRQRPSGSL